MDSKEIPPAMDFGDEKHLPDDTFLYHSMIIKDRGSEYTSIMASAGKETPPKETIRRIKKMKGHHSAAHHSYAFRYSDNGRIVESYSDDGESGAGLIILREMRKQRLLSAVVCIVRWYGGVMLYNDRFKHIQDATRYALYDVSA